MPVTTFAYTGAPVTYPVPAGVTSVTLECWGAAGGAGASSGLGGYSKGILIVPVGAILSVYVGGAGGAMGVGTAGWNGGGYGTGANIGGGGGTDVRLGGTALSNRVIVAGGGGGGYSSTGGAGGGTFGGASSKGDLGGTQTTGYALGVGQDSFAGAGGGYWGGFAGGGTGGGICGAGGSGYTGTLISPTMTNGVRAGAGQVVITAVNTAPLAPTLTTPAANTYIFASDINTLAWTVNDADPGDWQTRADLRYKKSGDVSWTTVASVAATVPSYGLPANTWTAGFAYEWQMSTFDAFSLQSPWSASSFANVIAALTAPTITNPAAASSQFSTPISVTWTVPTVPSSDAYQVVRSSATGAAGTIYYDSGIVISSALSASVPLDAVAGRTDYLSVRFRYGGRWSPYGSSTINNQYGPPQTPLLVLTPNALGAQVIVTITNPAAGGGYAETVSNDITRTSPDGAVDRIAKGLPPNATYVDRMVGAGVNDYKVTSYAASGSTAVSA